MSKSNIRPSCGFLTEAMADAKFIDKEDME